MTTVDHRGRFRSHVRCFIVLVSESYGLRYKSAEHVKNHGKSKASVNCMTWWFPSPYQESLPDTQFRQQWRMGGFNGSATVQKPENQEQLSDINVCCGRPAVVLRFTLCFLIMWLRKSPRNAKVQWHMLQAWSFSPLCRRTWASRIIGLLNLWPQISHSWQRPPSAVCWVISCTRAADLCVNFCPQTLHGNRRSPVWTAMWCSICAIFLNRFGHIGQPCGRSFVCPITCNLSPLAVEKARGQHMHRYAFKPSWTFRMCSFRPLERRNHFPHWLHGYRRSSECVRRWSRSLPDPTKLRPHSPQRNGRSLECKRRRCSVR